MIEYIDLTIDFANRNDRINGITLDRVTTRLYDTAIKFRIEIIGHALDEAYDVKILSKYHTNDFKILTTLGDSLEVVDGKLIYTPKVNLITEADYVRNYLYLSKDGLGLDMAQFNYQVDVSQIGEAIVEVRQVYDESYETLITEFEQALEDYKLTLPQADSVRAEIDVVLNQFGVDSQKAIGDLGEVSATIEIAEASRVEKESERVQAETERKEAETLREEAEFLRQESYDSKVDTAIVEADVVSKVDSKVTELTPQINNLTAQLAQKANDSEVRKKTVKLEQTDISETLLQQIAGTTAINAVPADHSIGPQKTDFLTSLTVNLYNTESAQNGYVASATGEILLDENFRVSDFIEVVSGESYATNSNAPGGFYNAEKVFVKNIPSSEPKPIVVPTGMGIKYMKVAFSGASISTARVFKGTTFHDFIEYDPRYQVDNRLIISKNNISEEKFVSKEDCTFVIERPKLNMFDKNKASVGYIVSSDGTLGAVGSTYAATDFIKVVAGEYYSHNGASNSLAIYDENKNFILRTYSTTVLIPAGGKYARWTIDLSQHTLDTFMIVEGSTIPITYEAYKGISTFKGIQPYYHNWSERLIAVLGDSITDMELWQPYVAEALGTQILSYGIGGSKIALSSADSMWQDVRINELPNNADLYIVMGGTNDWAANVVIGEGQTLDTNTFTGAYRTLLNKLITKYPTKHFALMSTPYGESPNREGWTDQIGILNNIGLSTKDYAEATRKVAKEYGIPCIDIDGESGFNHLTLPQFAPLEGGMLRVHPNVAGSKRMAELVIGKLRHIQPI